jgi:hypothetical protein
MVQTDFQTTEINGPSNLYGSSILLAVNHAGYIVPMTNEGIRKWRRRENLSIDLTPWRQSIGIEKIRK